jgi:hypothetical protein
LVPVAARFSCRVMSAAVACLACVACGTATGTGAGGAGVAQGREEGPVAAAVSVACQWTRTTGWWGRRAGWSWRGTCGRAGRRISRGREEGWWEVEVKVHALAQEVQWLAQECNEGNRKALLEDALEREGGGGGGSVTSCGWRGTRRRCSAVG